jgi:hypothetical protein
VWVPRVSNTGIEQWWYPGFFILFYFIFNFVR